MDIKSLVTKPKSLITSTKSKLTKDKTLHKLDNDSRSKDISSSSSSKFILLRRFNIKTRLIVSFILLLLLVILVTGISSYNSSTGTIDAKVKTYSLQVMSQTGVVLNNEISRMESYFFDIGMNDTVQNELINYINADDYDRFMISNTIAKYIRTKFTNVNDIEYCALMHGDNYSIAEEFNANNISFSDTKIAEGDFKQLVWEDINLKQHDKEVSYFTIQKDINGISTGSVIAKMVLIPKKNFLASSFKNLDIGKDSKTDKAFPIFVIDSKGKILASRDTETYPLGKSIDASKIVANGIVKSIKENPKQSSNVLEAGNLEIDITGSNSLVTYSKITKNKDWFVVSVVPYKYLNSAANALRTRTIVIGLLCLLFAFGLCLVIARSVSTPLGRLVLTMKKAKEGDLTSQIQDDGNDEIANVCHNYNDMLSNINSLVSQVRNSSQSLLGAANKITVASESTFNASSQVAVTVEQIAKGATDQASEINESVSHMDKLSEGITFVEDDVSQVIAIANKINNLSVNANKTINLLNIKSVQVSDTTTRVSENINDLSSSMKEIQKILKIMISISEQTNLLSLNAAIEAARAGEAGKGFAVVANEVKKLAEQSKEFTSNINNIISSIGIKTNNTVEEVIKSNLVVNEQISAVKDTEELFNTVFSAMEEVLKNIARTEKSVENIMKSKDKVLESMENVSAVAEESAATTQEISASTEEQIAACEELSDNAKDLKDLSEVLSRELNKFRTE